MRFKEAQVLLRFSFPLWLYVIKKGRQLILGMPLGNISLVRPEIRRRTYPLKLSLFVITTETLNIEVIEESHCLCLYPE